MSQNRLLARVSIQRHQHCQFTPKGITLLLLLTGLCRKTVSLLSVLWRIFRLVPRLFTGGVPLFKFKTPRIHNVVMMPCRTIEARARGDSWMIFRRKSLSLCLNGEIVECLWLVLHLCARLGAWSLNSCWSPVLRVWCAYRASLPRTILFIVLRHTRLSALQKRCMKTRSHTLFWLSPSVWDQLVTQGSSSTWIRPTLSLVTRPVRPSINVARAPSTCAQAPMTASAAQLPWPCQLLARCYNQWLSPKVQGMAVLPPARSVTIPKEWNMRCSPRHGSTRPCSQAIRCHGPCRNHSHPVPGLVQGPYPWQHCRCHPGSRRQARGYPSQLHWSGAANRHMN